MSGNPDDVDWLDLGPDPDEGKPPADPRRRYLFYGGAAALVVLALVLTRTQHGTDRAATSPGSPAALSSAPSSPGSFVDPSFSASLEDPTFSASFVDPPTSSRPLPSDVPVQVNSAGHRLLDVPTDWELFARGQDSLVRIQLALGRVSVTALPTAEADLPMGLFVGADRVIIPATGSSAAVVRDGKPVAELPASPQRWYLILPGPDQRHLWTGLEGVDGLALLTLDGTPTGARIPLPTMGTLLGSDGTGNVLVSGTGGTYLAKPGAVHRITTGVLVASGPTRWLTVECDDSFSCGLVVTDRTGGAHHALDTAIEWYEPNTGTISPDGRTAALPQSNGVSGPGIDLLNLDTGALRPVAATLNGTEQGPSFVWSPDSRWLFVVDSSRQIAVVDRNTGRAVPLGVQLPAVIRLAMRHRGG